MKLEVALQSLVHEDFLYEEIMRPFMVVDKELFVAGQARPHAIVPAGYLMYHAGMEGVAAISSDNIAEGGPTFPFNRESADGLFLMPTSHSLYLTRMELTHSIHLALKVHASRVSISAYIILHYNDVINFLY